MIRVNENLANDKDAKKVYQAAAYFTKFIKKLDKSAYRILMKTIRMKKDEDLKKIYREIQKLPSFKRKSEPKLFVDNIGYIQDVQNKMKDIKKGDFINTLYVPKYDAMVVLEKTNMFSLIHEFTHVMLYKRTLLHGLIFRTENIKILRDYCRSKNLGDHVPFILHAAYSGFGVKVGDVEYDLDHKTETAIVNAVINDVMGQM